MPDNEKPVPAEARQDVAKTSGTKAETAAATNPSDELSANDLKAVAGGVRKTIR